MFEGWRKAILYLGGDVVPDEVRYLYLRPAQIAKRRDECPIAYIPLGTIEWHGFHSPLGTDSLISEHFAIRCAQLGGGLAMPPLHWGDNRIEAIIDAGPAREGIAEAMGWDPEGATASRWMREEADQNRLYHDLLLHILNQVENYGFRVATFICGHYPLVDRAQCAILEYNKGCRKTGKMIAWATVDFLHLNDRYRAVAGGHSSGWETSYLLAAHPERVDLSTLPPRGEEVLGVFGPMPPHDASAELGEKVFQEVTEGIVKEAHKRLENPALYKKQGYSIRVSIEPDK